MIELANTDYKLLYLPSSTGIPNQNPSKIELKSIKNLLTTKETMVTLLNLIQSGQCISSGYNHNTGFGSIQSTSTKCLCENQFPLRKNDSGICNGSFTNLKDGSIMNCSCTIKILDAGQIKNLGN
jgi:hypothetical protein